MAWKPNSSISAVLAFLSLALLISADPNVIPANEADLDGWIVQNMRKYDERMTVISAAAEDPAKLLDPELAAAEVSKRTIRVMKDGSGDFTTVTDAVNSIPEGNKQRVVVMIGGGEYKEKILVNLTKPFVTFVGDVNDKPTITFDGTAAVFGTWNSATVVVESDYFVAVNINFVNSAPAPDPARNDGQAVALRISGDKAAFYNCSFISFQDTLCDDKGKHLFKDCLIQGTVDFIFGNGKSLYLRCKLISVATGVGVITAHGRTEPNEDTGFTFAYCTIEGSQGTGNTLLGRAWRERGRVVFAYSFMGNLIDKKGWSDFNDKERANTVYYGEYKCSGPGSSSNERVNFGKMLTEIEVEPFISLTFILGSKWLLLPPCFGESSSGQGGAPTPLPSLPALAVGSLAPAPGLPGLGLSPLAPAPGLPALALNPPAPTSGLPALALGPHTLAPGLPDPAPGL